MGLTRPKFTQINTTAVTVSDPLLVLNQGSTLANVDIGLLMNRNNGATGNVSLFWNESGNTFVLGWTGNSGTTNSNVSITEYANLKLGTLVGGTNSNIYVTGSILPTANVTYDLGSSTNRFKTLWLSGNTIALGKESVSVDDVGTWTFTSGANTVTVGALTNFQGNGAVVGNLTVTNSLTLLGNTYTITSEDLTVVDSVIELHTQSNLAPLASDDGKDIGFKFHYFKTQDEHAFLGWANDSGYLEWYDSGREGVGNVFSGNTYGTIKAGGAYFANSTPSTSTTTGALRVAGGVGIAGNLYIANTGDVSANIGAIKTTVDNLGNQQTDITSLQANAASQQTTIDVITGQINSIITNSNTNVAAYLSTSTGNISVGNVTASGNLYGSIVPTAIYKSVYLGSSTVDLSRSSGSLTIDDFNTTGYAAQANLATLATNATKTTVTANTTAGTTYVTYASAINGNIDQHVSTALTFNPATGNLRTYTGFVDTDLTVANILYVATGIRWAGNGNVFASGSGGGGGGTFTASNTAPSSPNPSDFWYYVADDILFQYINDGDSNQWVDIGSPSSTQTQNITDVVLSNVTVSSWSNVSTIRTSLGITPTTVGVAPPVSPNLGDTWYNTNEDVMYQYINDGVGDWWVDISSDGFSTIAGTNLLDTRVQGNIIPTSNITYSLGNITHQWKDLYVSSNTIYIGGVAVGISNGNLLVNNAPIIPAATYSNVEVAAYLKSTGGLSSSVDSIILPVGNTAQRPSSPQTGMIRYNTTLGRFEGYVPAGGWQNILSDQYQIEYLVVAGGGGGASRHSGGGGAGGMLTATGFTVTPNQTYSVTIGAGGAGSTVTGTATNGSSGANSTFASITATGGGYGGGTAPTATGGSGGSGGGGGNGALGGSGTAGQGYAGGKNSPANDYHGGGGGGAGGVGGDVTGAAGGTGGPGLASDITGTSVIYACGGGGSAFQGLGSGGEGGAGGSSGVNGGKGAGSTSGSAGTANTGTGGGGGSGSEGAYNGGSGVVIVRYLGPQRGSGGTYSSSGGYSIHRFTSTGTFTA
jgi:hypothetical protein